MDSLFKVLLVDDQHYVIAGLNEQLNWQSFHGILCGSAANGRQALDLMTACRPDAIISDIKMSEIDGLELARRIDESPRYSGIPVILLSGYREFEYAKKAMKYHVTDYILKPISRTKLRQLEEILLDLYNKKETSKKNLIDLTRSNYQEEISLALRNHDINKIEDFFQSSVYRDSMNGTYADIMGARLLSLLYNYLEDIHVNPDSLSASCAHTLASFYELPDMITKMNYIETSYLDLLGLISNQKKNNTEPIYRHAEQYIAEYFTDSSFNISFLASKLNISLSYLSTIFTQHAGIHLITYVTDKRIAHAKRLLAAQNCSVSEVARQSGYEDPRYFSSLFKKKTGMTPKEYRNCQ